MKKIDWMFWSFVFPGIFVFFALMVVVIGASCSHTPTFHPPPSTHWNEENVQVNSDHTLLRWNGNTYRIDESEYRYHGREKWVLAPQKMAAPGRTYIKFFPHERDHSREVREQHERIWELTE